MRVRNRSKKRDAILAKLRSTKTHPTAEWIYLELKQDIPELSLATVYRNLNQFREEGEILSVGTVAGQERFDGDTSSHVHFVCKSCQSVSDVDVPAECVAIAKEVKRLGYQVESTSVVIHGQCKACLKA